MAGKLFDRRDNFDKWYANEQEKQAANMAIMEEVAARTAEFNITQAVEWHKRASQTKRERRKIMNDKKKKLEEKKARRALRAQGGVSKAKKKTTDVSQYTPVKLR